MTTSHLTDRDIEAVFAGSTMREPELVAIQELFSSMRETLVVDPPADHVSAFAAVLAQAAIDAPPMAKAKASNSWRKRLVAIGVAVGISAFGVAGAAVANEAAPGDTLYGVDKALESVGILDGGTSERLQESQVLASRGDVNGAVALTAKALDADGQHEAAVALERAVVAVKSQSSGGDVRAQVSSMLAWMSQQKRGADFGAQVSEHAKEIASANAHSKANPPAEPGSKANPPAEPGSKANPPAEPGSKANPPAEPGSKANPPAEPGSKANPPAEPGSKANPPADPGSKANPPADPGSKANPPAPADGKKS
ncbi:hypothetical protein [Demequina lutea]|uniref:DUF5667 domain-containing protein n=1 Tax=Demequina lutea TaxID=431489 RepID=A0A7Y9Z8R3_9MICO|nr:hypothetical protein [Demequina lutea]NYI40912.1 hypothetical protein [Demequina lutea]